MSKCSNSLEIAASVSTVHLDFETYSEINLKISGAYVYAAHPSTLALCLTYKIDDGIVKSWMPDIDGYDCPPDLADAIKRGAVLKGWHVNFERLIWRHVMVAKHGWPAVPDDDQWVCTMAKAAACGMPLGLDDCGAALGIDAPFRKDKRGKALLDLLSKPGKATKTRPAGRRRDEMKELHLVSYCAQDTRAEYAIDRRLPDLPPDEQKVFRLDRKVNDRGLRFDLPLVRALRRIADEALAHANTAMTIATGGEVRAVTETARLVEWARVFGWEGDSVAKEHVEAALADDGLPDEVRAAFTIRAEAGKSSARKLDTMLACTDDLGYARGLFQYHGASTGRQAGRLIQPQNFPRPSLKGANGKPLALDFDLLAVGNWRLVEAIYGPGTALVVVADALRGTIIPSPGNHLPRADLSAIEARVVLWLAGHDDAMMIFAAGKCIYCEQASALTGRTITRADPERQHGKTIILGCGFQMGWRKFQATAAKVGWILTDEQAQEAVASYREKWWRVPELWTGLNRAAVNAVRNPGRKFSYRCIDYQVRGEWLLCRLPSGRTLKYYQPGLVVDPDKEWAGEQVVYWTMRQIPGRQRIWSQVTGYGGMWTENIVQAIARDVMMHGALLAEDAGYPIVLQVHDENGADAPLHLPAKGIADCMSVTPSYLPGLVLAAEANAEGTGQRYGK